MSDANTDLPANMDQWLERFRFYRSPPDRERIQNWLSQFDEADHPIAERLLDKIVVVSDADIQHGYRDFLGGADGWSRQEDQRNGRWVFLGFGGPGESGPHMLRIFREANELTAQRYNSLFVTARDLASLKLTAEDTVVFIDDISASGDQVCKLWPTLKELIASEAKTILLLTAITYCSKERLEIETDLEIHYRDYLDADCDFFHDRCEGFSVEEKGKIEGYCRRADPNNPKGYGDCGLMYVLYHKTPNNCLPVIHIQNDRWSGILPRYTLPRAAHG